MLLKLTKQKYDDDVYLKNIKAAKNIHLKFNASSVFSNTIFIYLQYYKCKQ